MSIVGEGWTMEGRLRKSVVHDRMRYNWSGTAVHLRFVSKKLGAAHSIDTLTKKPALRGPASTLSDVACSQLRAKIAW